MPGKEVADGFLVILGGALLIAPGFITDIFGVLFLLPPTRAVARRVLRRWTVGRVAVVGFPGGATMGGFGGGPERPAAARREPLLRLRRRRRRGRRGRRLQPPPPARRRLTRSQATRAPPVTSRCAAPAGGPETPLCLEFSARQHGGDGKGARRCDGRSSPGKGQPATQTRASASSLGPKSLTSTGITFDHTGKERRRRKLVWATIARRRQSRR